MKRILIVPLLMFTFQSFSQNEFAASAFYSSFKRIFEDAQSGFQAVKGAKRPSSVPDLYDEFKLKWMLPMTDSGKLVEPVNGKAFVIYYFESDKIRLKVDQRANDMKEAILNATNIPFTTRSQTTLVKEKPLTIHDYYLSEDQQGPAIMRHMIWYAAGKYHLSLEIRQRDKQ